VIAKFSLGFIGFLQALGIFIYCSLIGLLMWKGNDLFGPMSTFLGPTLFLIIFIISAVVCCLLFLGYPFILFWEKKQTKNALRLVLYTSGWLTLLILLILLSFAFWPLGS
jgi:hypothetical protein